MLSGKCVIAPKQQILEVQNAILAYEESTEWDAFSVEDMLHAHGCMMQCPTISAKEIAEQRALSPRQIEKHISALKKKGIIERVGARKNGLWQVNIN